MRIAATFAGLLAFACAMAAPPAGEPAGKPSLEGRSFQGCIRAKGILGLFCVKGTLSFADGMLVWSVKGSRDAAPYETREADGVLRFTSRMPAHSGTFVDWSGSYEDGRLHQVTAVWTRTAEEDFVHDLFLPDVVTLVFEPARSDAEPRDGAGSP